MVKASNFANAIKIRICRQTQCTSSTKQQKTGGDYLILPLAVAESREYAIDSNGTNSLCVVCARVEHMLYNSSNVHCV